MKQIVYNESGHGCIYQAAVYYSEESHFSHKWLMEEKPQSV